MKDVPTMLLREGFVSDMVQGGRLAVLKDVPIMYRMEEFVSGTVQR